MKMRVDSQKYEAETTVTVRVRDVLDNTDFDDLFEYLVRNYEKSLKEEAKAHFGFLEEDA